MASLDALRSQEERERLEALFRYAQVGRCVNGVTHEINNCLGAIMAYSELLATDGDNGDNAQMIEEILRGVRRCSDLVTQLTGIARKERPNANIVDMGQTVTRVCALRQYDMRVNRITCEASVKDPGASIIVDGPKIEMALLYLLSNAIECLEDQPEDSRRIRVTVRREAEGVEAAIWNSGPAAPESIREMMFEPFYTTRDNGAHLGLGLHMASAIVDGHGGTLTYCPERGFLMWLPKNNALTDEHAGDNGALPR